MKYIIMCGGDYPKFDTPKQLLRVNGEILVERTIRLLKENGVNDIAISTNNPAFDYLANQVQILENNCNKFVYGGKDENIDASKSWLNAYYLVNEPVCYLHGDVYFSEDAIKRIVNKNVKDCLFICVPDKYDIANRDKRNIHGREPLGYKVENYEKFNYAVSDLLTMVNLGEFKNAKIKPLSWTVYRYLNGLDIHKDATSYGELNSIFRTNGEYMMINDYTTDIDFIDDVKKIEEVLKDGNNSNNN